jgi:hypothetical protein
VPGPVDGDPLVPALDELTAIQADAVRATAAAHDRDPEDLAVELQHLLTADPAPGAVDAVPAIPAPATPVPATPVPATDDDTVRILLPEHS